MCIIYIYIYIYREREREMYLSLSLYLSLSIYIYICIYIYIYIYISLSLYIYIYIYIYYVYHIRHRDLAFGEQAFGRSLARGKPHDEVFKRASIQVDLLRGDFQERSPQLCPDSRHGLRRRSGVLSDSF